MLACRNVDPDRLRLVLDRPERRRVAVPQKPFGALVLHAYCVLLAGLTILCFVNAALVLVAALLGLPLP